VSEHYVCVNPLLIPEPHDYHHVVICTTCGYREETVTVEYAKLLAVKHIRDSRAGRLKVPA
jgi:hypothetical protein